ncbi:MAG: hypothetical protein IT340_03410 [Chloroflexi bacterium]|nr:hypothetical protein [Chloroflexota bacterium]
MAHHRRGWLLGAMVRVAVSGSALRGSVAADLDLHGRHPSFRWSVERREADPISTPVSAGPLPPVDR